MNTVEILWLILLIVAVLVLPFIVSLLHRAWRAAHNIEIYFKEMNEAGTGIAGNTGNISALDSTISVASGILTTAGAINEHADTIKTTLTDRAKNL